MGKEAKHVVRLGAKDREWLQVLIREGGTSAYRIEAGARCC